MEKEIYTPVRYDEYQLIMFPTDRLEGAVFLEPDNSCLIRNSYAKNNIRWKDCKYYELFIISLNCLPGAGEYGIAHDQLVFIPNGYDAKDTDLRLVVASTDKDITPDCWIDIDNISSELFDYYRKTKELPKIYLEMEKFQILKDYMQDTGKHIMYKPRVNDDNSIIIKYEMSND